MIARLRRGAEALGVTLDDAQVAKLGRYLALLQQWNRKINLTAVVEPGAVIDKHFLDSLAVSRFLDGVETLVDLGSGAGFPGVVLAIVRPTLKVTSVDATQKKIAFQQTLRREVAPNVEPICARDDAFTAQGRTFGAAVSRATWDPPEWLEHGAPLVAPGGVLLAMQAADRSVLPPPAGFDPLTPFDYEVAGAPRRIQAFRRS